MQQSKADEGAAGQVHPSSERSYIQFTMYSSPDSEANK
jgi:hypothetical protein